MTYIDFLTEVIERGLKSVQSDPLITKHPRRLKGSIDGFNACREKQPSELAVLLYNANEKTTELRNRVMSTPDAEDEAFWEQNYFGVQVDFVCNVVSAALYNSGQPVIVPPRVSGVRIAAEILGVAGGA